MQRRTAKREYEAGYRPSTAPCVRVCMCLVFLWVGMVVGSFFLVGDGGGALRMNGKYCRVAVYHVREDRVL